MYLTQRCLVTWCSVVFANTKTEGTPIYYIEAVIDALEIGKDADRGQQMLDSSFDDNQLY